MANDSIDHYKVLSETDLFSTMSKTDHFISSEDHHSSRKILFNNSKSLRTSLSNHSIEEHFHTHLPTISVNQMLKTQNNNAPWLFNILTKKFHRRSSREIANQFLARQISCDGSSGCWIIHEKEVDCSDMKAMIFLSFQNSDQNHISHVASLSDSPQVLSTDDSLHLHHYHSSETPVIDHFTSMIKTHYSNRRQLTKSNDSEDLPMMMDSSRLQRAKSASASPRHKAKKTKKKSKYYEERLLTSEEMQLRESLRLIDLDNIGFFSPNQLHKVLKDIGLHSHQIDNIQRCLPLDDDGHYSIDNLVKLLLP